VSTTTLQMDVLYMQTYGHVLGIFTRNAEPSQMEATADSFVGDGFHLRGLTIPPPPGPPQDFLVPASYIAVFRAPLDLSQLSIPLALCVSPPLTGTPPSRPTSAVPFSVVGALGDTVSAYTLTLAGGFPSATDVLVLIEAEGGGTPYHVAWTIPAASPSPVNISLPPLPHGTYYLVAFVPGFPITPSLSFTV